MNHLEACLRDWRRKMDGNFGTDRADGPLGDIVSDFIFWAGISFAYLGLSILILFLVGSALWEALLF